MPGNLKKAAFAATGVVIIAALAFAATFAWRRTPPAPTVQEPTSAPAADAKDVPHALGSVVSLVIGSEATFDGGLVVTLEAVDDSRCPKGVQCIWAGELAPSLRVRGGLVEGDGQTLRLGTVREPTRTFAGYIFAIEAADEKSVGVRVFLADAVPAGWVTVREEALGYAYSRPATLGGNVWNVVDWPPVVTVTPAGQDPLKSGCRAFASGRGDAETLVKKGEGRTVNAPYVRYEGSGAAAGSLYQEYCYDVQGSERSYVVDVVVRSHTGCGDGQCGAYCGTPNEKECRDLDRDAAYVRPLEDMIRTFLVISRR